MSATLYSDRLGAQCVDGDDLVEFGSGRVFALLPGRLPLYWLQSADDPGLAIPVANPYEFFPSFAIRSDPAGLAAIGGPPERVWVAVHMGADPTADLRAPILVRGGRGVQVLNEAPGADLRAPLYAARGPRAT